MALKKSYTYKGVTAEYWKIKNISCNAITGTSVVEVALFLSKEVRDEDLGNSLTTLFFSFELVDLAREDAYTQLKTLDMFLGAEDI